MDKVVIAEAILLPPPQLLPGVLSEGATQQLAARYNCCTGSASSDQPQVADAAYQACEEEASAMQRPSYGRHSKGSRCGAAAGQQRPLESAPSSDCRSLHERAQLSAGSGWQPVPPAAACRKPSNDCRPCGSSSNCLQGLATAPTTGATGRSCYVGGSSSSAEGLQGPAYGSHCEPHTAASSRTECFLASQGQQQRRQRQEELERQQRPFRQRPTPPYGHHPPPAAAGSPASTHHTAIQQSHPPCHPRIIRALRPAPLPLVSAGVACLWPALSLLLLLLAAVAPAAGQGDPVYDPDQGCPPYPMLAPALTEQACGVTYDTVRCQLKTICRPCIATPEDVSWTFLIIRPELCPSNYIDINCAGFTFCANQFPSPPPAPPSPPSPPPTPPPPWPPSPPPPPPSPPPLPPSPPAPPPPPPIPPVPPAPPPSPPIFWPYPPSPPPAPPVPPPSPPAPPSPPPSPPSPPAPPPSPPTPPTPPAPPTPPPAPPFPPFTNPLPPSPPTPPPSPPSPPTPPPPPSPPDPPPSPPSPPSPPLPPAPPPPSPSPPPSPPSPPLPPPSPPLPPAPPVPPPFLSPPSPPPLPPRPPGWVDPPPPSPPSPPYPPYPPAPPGPPNPPLPPPPSPPPSPPTPPSPIGLQYPPSPPPMPPGPAPKVFEIPQGQQLTIHYSVPGTPTPDQLAAAAQNIATTNSISVKDVNVTTRARYLTGVYTLIPMVPTTAPCTRDLEIQLEATLCNQLALPNCSYVEAECIKPVMERIPFYPGAPVLGSGTINNGRRHRSLLQQQEQQQLGWWGEQEAVGSADALVSGLALGREEQGTVEQQQLQLDSGANVTSGDDGSVDVDGDGDAGGDALELLAEDHISGSRVDSSSSSGGGSSSSNEPYHQLQQQQARQVGGRRLRHREQAAQQQEHQMHAAAVGGVTSAEAEAERLRALLHRLRAEAAAAAAANPASRQPGGGGLGAAGAGRAVRVLLQGGDPLNPNTIYYLAVRILMDAETDNADFVLKLFQKNITMLGYTVIQPAAGNVTQSSSLAVTVRNPEKSAFPILKILDTSIINDIALGVGIPPSQVFQEDQGVIGPIPGKKRKCDDPQLGVLCGADAVGAIIGICLGGLVVIGLLLGAILYARRGRMSKVVVMDDFAWARKYAHIVPTNVIASPYVTQYGPGGQLMDNTNMYK